MAVRHSIFAQKNITINSDDINCYCENNDQGKPILKANTHRILTDLDLNGLITSFGDVGNTPNLQAATVEDQVAHLQPAAEGFPGVISTSNQVLGGGDKEAVGSLITRKRLRAPTSITEDEGVIQFGDGAKKARIHMYSNPHAGPNSDNANHFWGKNTGNFTLEGEGNIGIGEDSLSNGEIVYNNLVLNSGKRLTIGYDNILFLGANNLEIARGVIILGVNAAGQIQILPDTDASVILGKDALSATSSNPKYPIGVIIGHLCSGQKTVKHCTMVGFGAGNRDLEPAEIEYCNIFGWNASFHTNESTISAMNVFGSGPTTNTPEGTNRSTWIGDFDKDRGTNTRLCYAAGVYDSAWEGDPSDNKIVFATPDNLLHALPSSYLPPPPVIIGKAMFTLASNILAVSGQKDLFFDVCNGVAAVDGGTYWNYTTGYNALTPQLSDYISVLSNKGTDNAATWFQCVRDCVLSIDGQIIWDTQNQAENYQAGVHVRYAYPNTGYSVSSSITAPTYEGDGSTTLNFDHVVASNLVTPPITPSPFCTGQTISTTLHLKAGWAFCCYVHATDSLNINAVLGSMAACRTYFSFSVLY
jgi:hypothetical protein